jgi:hypothetical protein
MSEYIRSTYLCLLDDVNLVGNITIDEFDIGYYSTKELISLLEGSDECVSSEERRCLEIYSEFPWARKEKIKTIPIDKIKNDFECMLITYGYTFDLTYIHAGMVSWEPFTELIRTLNLLKESPGPVITRQFYHTPNPSAKTKGNIGKVIYGEPAFDYIDGSGDRIRPLLLEYGLEKEDVAGFSKLREQLNKCMSKDSHLPNCHLRTAIHYFENGDRRLQAITFPGSFNAIDPLMSFEAALEALVILESDDKVGNKLPRRISASINDGRSEVQSFCKRVFWLRSKVAHGVKPVEEIEGLIIDKPNAEIPKQERGGPIPEGNYKELLLTSNVFPGFLINLREITRRTIRFFCDEYLTGRCREDTLKELDH